MTKVLGIDLAAQPLSTAVCLLEIDSGRLLSVQVKDRQNDGQLSDAMAAADVVAIDAPFGWPDAFRKALGASEDGAWPDTARTGKGARSYYDFSNLRLRETDRVVASTIDRYGTSRRLRPLSVSSDSIGVVAFRAAALLRAFSKEHDWKFSRVGGSSGDRTRVIEVYPAATLGVLWAASKARDGATKPLAYKAKGVDGIEARRDLATLLMEFAGLAVSEHVMSADVLDTEHRFDAFASAITGWMFEDHRVLQPTRDQSTVAVSEGWIYFPDPSAPT